MENKNLLRSDECDWILGDVIPDTTTTEEGTPVKLKPLNLRQSLFVKEYLKDFDATRAGKAVGYADGRALQNLNVRRAVQLEVKQRMKTMEMDAQWVIGMTREVVERCMDDGNFQPLPALKGLELLGKNFALFKDHSVIEHNHTHRFDPGALTIEELELVNKLAGGDNIKVIEHDG